MQRPPYIPENATNVEIVGSLAEVFNTPFSRETNLVLHPRPLYDDYNPLAEVLFPEISGYDLFASDDYAELEDLAWLERFCARAASAFGNLTRQIVGDWQKFIAHGMDTTRLRVEKRRAATEIFHHDGYLPLGRALCSYNRGATLGLRNEDAVKNLFSDGYSPKKGVTPFQLAVGDISRHAGKDDPVAARFIHSAPPREPKPRLLLVGENGSSA